jgi:hypothetical protein
VQGQVLDLRRSAGSLPSETIGGYPNGKKMAASVPERSRLCRQRFVASCDLLHRRGNSVLVISPINNEDGVVSPIVIGFCIFSTLGLILLECILGLGF